jgi:WD40 repeat protein
MNWPTSQDFNEAVQNAASSFADPALKTGEVTVNALGLPVPRSGNFADVYQFKGGDGKMWAVKCFTRKVAGLQQRYLKIDEHLTKARLPFTVGFKFFEEGIRVRGQWFPLLKMEWVEGFTLNEFIRDNADKPQYLHALLQMWAKLTARLRDSDFAHADLQHGNVLLVPGDAQNKLGLKLIDYDGMWVPALADMHSGEIGHPNFQHPLRLKNRLYNGDVDRFPHLVVACALRATLIGGRALWDRFDNGDNLLFKEADLRDPAAAPVFRSLWNLRDDVLCTLLGKMALAAQEPLRKTPWLDELLLAKAGPRLGAEEEKKVIEVLGVAPHFTAGKPVTALPASAQEEFGHFDFADDQTDETPAVRQQVAKARRKPGPEEKKQSKLPYYVGGGALAAVLIGVVVAITAGGKQKEPPARELAKNEVNELESKLPGRVEKKDKTKDFQVVPTPEKKDRDELKKDSPEAPSDPVKELPTPADNSAKEATPPKPSDAPSNPVELPKAPEQPAVFDNLDLAQAVGNVTKQDGFVRLDSSRSPATVGTKQSYTGDVDITVVARTNNRNIRLYAFNGASIIFNWELRPDELRITRPNGRIGSESGTLATAKVQRLATDTWYTLRWLITRNGMSIYVDGQMVFEEKMPYDLSTPAPIKVRTLFKSIVDVKSVVVTPLSPGKEPSLVPAVWLAAPKRIWKTNASADFNCMVFSDDGTQVLSCTKKSPKTIHVYNAADGKPAGESIDFPAPISTMRMAPRNLLMATTNENKLTAFDYKLKKTAFTLDIADKEVRCPVAADADAVIVDEANGVIGVYSLADGSKIKESKMRQPAPIKCLDCTADGKTIAAFMQAGGLWLKKNNLVRIEHYNTAGVQGGYRAALSPDGSLLALSVGKGAIMVVDTSTGKLHRTLNGAREVVDMAFAKDSRHFVAVSVDRILYGWDVDNALPAYRVPLEGRAKALAMSPNGQYLAIATEGEDSLQLWQVDGGKK